jgi:hypothetical protein
VSYSYLLPSHAVLQLGSLFMCLVCLIIVLHCEYCVSVMRFQKTDFPLYQFLFSHTLQIHTRQLQQSISVYLRVFLKSGHRRHRMNYKHAGFFYSALTKLNSVQLLQDSSKFLSMFTIKCIRVEIARYTDGLWAGWPEFDFRQGNRFFSAAQRPDRFWDPSNLLSNG